MEQHYAVAGATAAGRVRHQVELPLDVNDSGSLGLVDDILAERAHEQAAHITDTTRTAIYEALQQGMAEGEGITELTTRINDIFDVADERRARMIAQTEAVGALNQAASAYANSLPDGIVARKVWLAHHDTRTRATHRIADGQTVAADAMFWVGGSPMTAPGDRAAPPGEVINCRCDHMYLPPNASLNMVSNSLEGLIPQTSMDALNAIQGEWEAKRLADVAATASPG
jgi:uncharacterized protein with gpF-like domain